MTCLFYLGAPSPLWLERTDVPLFLSRRAFLKGGRFPRARGRWALDSGGFSELNLEGRWRLKPKRYVAEVRHLRDEVGNLDWAAVQDWMCEPGVRLKTGLSVVEHQARTIESYEELRALAPDVRWLPVLQGWRRRDYRRHLRAYRERGHDDTFFGLGSVCRRQGTAVAEQVVRDLAKDGVRVHAFGFKTLGLRRVGDLLVSADSTAWSVAARWRPPLPGCAHAHCSSCILFALRWRDSVLSGLPASGYS